MGVWVCFFLYLVYVGRYLVIGGFPIDGYSGHLFRT